MPPEEFVYENRKHKDSDSCGEGLDYRLEEYNKKFKLYLHCLFPNFDDWVTVCSNTIELEKMNLGHKIDYGTLRDKSEVTAPDYASRAQSLICAPNPDFSHFREYLESIKK